MSIAPSLRSLLFVLLAGGIPLAARANALTELATLVPEPPGGDAWFHEMKFDGYRILARIQGGSARLLSRRDNDWTDRFAPVAAAVAALPVKTALLDGEVAVETATAVSDASQPERRTAA